jgi:hypothetical protein
MPVDNSAAAAVTAFILTDARPVEANRKEMRTVYPRLAEERY